MCQDTQCLIMRETILLGLQPLYDVGTLSLLASHASEAFVPALELTSSVLYSPREFDFDESQWTYLSLPTLYC